MAFSTLGTLESKIYTRSLTIDHTQVPSTQSNFPVLVAFTNSTFKTVFNGGHVHNSPNGYDIGFFSDSGGTTPLKWEIERYDSAAGNIVAWVKLASVSSVSDTVFYMRYGDATITTDQSDAVNTFSNSFLNVYHLKDGTTLSLTDSLGNNNGANFGVTSTPGNIDGGGNFVNAKNQYFSNSNLALGTSLTMSAWVYAATIATDYNFVIGRAISSQQSGSIAIKSNGKLFCSVRATSTKSYDGTGSHTLSTATWYYLTMTYDSTNGLIGYVNAASDGTATANGNIDTTSGATNIGRDLVNQNRWWDGVIDEVRIASAVRSADWITCEYNNQVAGSTFVTLGAET